MPQQYLINLSSRKNFLSIGISAYKLTTLLWLHRVRSRGQIPEDMRATGRRTEQGRCQAARRAHASVPRESAGALRMLPSRCGAPYSHIQ